MEHKTLGYFVNIHSKYFSFRNEKLSCEKPFITFIHATFSSSITEKQIKASKSIETSIFITVSQDSHKWNVIGKVWTKQNLQNVISTTVQYRPWKFYMI